MLDRAARNKLQGIYASLNKQTMRDKDIADRIVIERALEIFRRQASGTDSGNKPG
jgi:hypothetical protein